MEGWQANDARVPRAKVNARHARGALRRADRRRDRRAESTRSPRRCRVASKRDLVWKPHAASCAAGPGAGGGGARERCVAGPRAATMAAQASGVTGWSNRILP